MILKTPSTIDLKILCATHIPPALLELSACSFGSHSSFGGNWRIGRLEEIGIPEKGSREGPRSVPGGSRRVRERRGSVLGGSREVAGGSGTVPGGSGGVPGVSRQGPGRLRDGPRTLPSPNLEPTWGQLEAKLTKVGPQMAPKRCTTDQKSIQKCVFIVSSNFDRFFNDLLVFCWSNNHRF